MNPPFRFSIGNRAARARFFVSLPSPRPVSLPKDAALKSRSGPLAQSIQSAQVVVAFCIVFVELGEEVMVRDCVLFGAVVMVENWVLLGILDPVVLEA